ncbi:BLUF domain-containing protein [Brevundimonas sp.]|uniref:BLUF domain-containing protein n=1 Tax=Brevundimonas sp. TaxID=1871086 RepID=UPI0025C26BDA|nr:BLUF domain-containing protein [Brevundimonas sp.]
MLFRVVFVSELVADAGQTTRSVAEILGACQRNNQRDEITSALIFHRGEAAQMIEGKRVDIDRLLARVSRDPRHRNLRVLHDRPVLKRQTASPVRLNALSRDQAQTLLQDRRLSHLSADGLQRLLMCDHLTLAA